MARYCKIALAGSLLSWILVATAWTQQASDMDGHVFDQANGRGLENLEVKVTPPSGASLPIRLASTDQNGQFRFSQLKPGRYLLEVSQGANLLYRVQVNAGAQSHVEIPLQRR